MGLTAKWWGVVSAFALFGLEPLLKAFWPTAHRQLERLSSQTRTRIEVAIAIVALFYAGFSAWLEEHEEKIKLEQKVIESQTSPYHWKMLNSEEALALRSEIRGIEPEGEGMFILCAEADCNDLAKTFRDVFRDLNWTVKCCNYIGTFDPGIHLWATDSRLQGIADKIELATKGRLKVQITQQSIMDPARFHLQIMIGPKS